MQDDTLALKGSKQIMTWDKGPKDPSGCVLVWGGQRMLAGAVTWRAGQAYDILLRSGHFRQRVQPGKDPEAETWFRFQVLKGGPEAET